MDNAIRLLCKIVFILSVPLWISSCGLGFYKSENSLLSVGIFFFFVALLFSPDEDK